MSYLTTIVGDVEYGAAIHHDGLGHGLFHRGREGSWVQDRGTAQTPSWSDERVFRRWLLRQLREMDIAMGERPRGGRRPGAGRPATTRSGATQRVVYRVTSEQRAELSAEAARLGLASADLAAKRRAFPG